ncbi:hypothetical protein K438DRAFT_1758165 [Mycena galopus ATCC 62051]|nr:hypothetical protein K438DRAFT_1758165 [Mycena galopus ATCC 62051]
MYQSLFTVMVNQALAKENFDFERLGSSFFEPAARRTSASERKTAKEGMNLENRTPDINVKGIFVLNSNEFSKHQRVEIEEVEDEEERAEWRKKPKALKSIIEPMESVEGDEETQMDLASDRRHAAAEEFWFQNGKLSDSWEDEESGEESAGEESEPLIKEGTPHPPSTNVT